LIIAFHSYKGGTGKTLLSVNLASILASKGKKICLLDFDFSAPSLYTIFKKNQKKFWLNDFLNRACKIDRVLNCCSSIYAPNGNLYVGLANPSTKAIREMSSKDRKWEMQALGTMLSLKNYISDKLDFDYVILDTSPGLRYSSINAVFTSDISFLVTSLERSDLKGSQFMLEDLYKLFKKKTKIILNKVPREFSSSKQTEKLPFFLDEPVEMSIPCFCDLPKSDNKFFFALKYPDHAFSKTLYEMAERID
jgi:septum site-determining protein MinD